MKALSISAFHFDHRQRTKDLIKKKDLMMTPIKHTSHLRMFRRLLNPVVFYATYASSLAAPRVIPITVLSGFLGSGKTTLLQNLLNNNKGLKIAVIVNDVAEVNIDNKLIVGNVAKDEYSEQKKPAGAVELSNGCLCCSLADELLPSVSELVTLSDMKSPTGGKSDNGFDHIVIESSGVATPKNIRSQFQDAEFYDMPLLQRVQLDTMVTVVDCSTFLDHLEDREGRRINEEESPDLFYKNEEERLIMENKYEDRWIALENSPTTHKETATVSQLLCEQVEIADVVLLNKVDALNEESSGDRKLNQIRRIVNALNGRAKIFKTKFGVVDSLGDVLGAAKGEGVADAGISDDHRDAIEALENELSHSHGHEHSHDHSHEQHHESDHGHDHSHHGHEHEHDHSHHGHEHDHGHEPLHSGIEVCDEPGCTENHSHSHNHVDEESTCIDPNCTDESHSHSHSHSHENDLPGGIGSFIYRARKPFSPKRLHSLLTLLPVVRGLPSTSSPAAAKSESLECSKVFSKILRSKGFCWLADSNIAAMYWSHAGSSFEMQCLGRWWATLPREQWPDEALSEILADFDNKNHDEFGETWKSVGDRRQEIVLIGPGMGDAANREIIQKALDQCLLSEDEFEIYKGFIQDENALKAEFESSIPVQMLSY